MATERTWFSAGRCGADLGSPGSKIHEFLEMFQEHGHQKPLVILEKLGCKTIGYTKKNLGCLTNSLKWPKNTKGGVGKHK